VINIHAFIRAIQYKPQMCRSLPVFSRTQFQEALNTSTSFLLEWNNTTKYAISPWVSPKRTRSYPYARVYDTLGHQGKRITIIPVIKDEGIQGDRDFVQWDTIALMTLLNVHVILSYYSDAQKSSRYEGKITAQKFDFQQVLQQMSDLETFQSDAFHWNQLQVQNIENLLIKALDSHRDLSGRLGVRMHSEQTAYSRIKKISSANDAFMHSSRTAAEQAQAREIQTVQPKERVMGKKAKITIKNYLGGEYFLTCDEFSIEGNELSLVECKHTKKNGLPAEEDIKDGIVKMILFSNLTDVKVSGLSYKPIPTLKLTHSTSGQGLSLSPHQASLLEQVRREAEINGFRIIFS